MKSEALEKRIKLYFEPPAWALFPELRSCTGYQKKVRYADAVAVSTYPSRGLYLHGLEIKVSRSDLMRELSEPRKADEIGRHCSYWSLVVPDEEIIKGLAIPESWGVLLPHGATLRSRRKPTLLKAEPPTIELVASIARRTAEIESGYTKNSDIEKVALERAKVIAESDKAFNARNRDYELDRAREDLKHLREAVTKFEDASGIKLSHYSGKRIGENVKMLDAFRSRMDFSKDAITRAKRDVAEVARTMEDLLKSIEAEERVIAECLTATS